MINTPGKTNGLGRNWYANKTIDAISSLKPLNWGKTHLQNGVLDRNPIDVLGFDPWGFTYHFEVEQKDSTHVEVHAGRHNVYFNGVTYTLLLTVDGGVTSGLYADVKEVEVLASGWIRLVVARSGGDATHGVPSGLTAEYYASYVDSPDIINLAYVTVVSGAITDIEQVWTGGDVSEDRSVPDGLSLGEFGLDYGGIVRRGWAIGGWPDPANYEHSVMSATDSFIVNTEWNAAVRTAVDWPSPRYIQWSTLVSNMATDLVAAGGPWETPPWTGVYWELGAVANKAYGQEIGNDSQQKVIDLDEQALYHSDGTKIAEWGTNGFDVAAAKAYYHGGVQGQAAGSEFAGGILIAVGATVETVYVQDSDGAAIERKLLVFA